MSNASEFYVGILLTALVNTIIAGVALMFFVFLARRWATLQDDMRAYGLFYLITAAAWFWIATRYIIVGVGYEGAWVTRISQITQTLLVFTGPPLLYYAGRRLFNKSVIAKALAFLSFGAASVSVYFLLQPWGIGVPRIEFFSADAPINALSLRIFISEVALIAIMLFFDLASRLYAWSQSKDTKVLYTALYSFGVLVYVAIGGIDQMKLLTGGFLVVFRTLYAAAFLFTYVIIVKREALEESYFTVEEESQSTAE